MKDYRTYLRDLQLDDDLYYDFIDDLLDEIFSYTNLFRKEIYFNVLNGLKEYNFNAILIGYENTTDTTTIDDSTILISSLNEPNGSSYSKRMNNVIDILDLKNQSVMFNDFKQLDIETFEYIGLPVDSYKTYKVVLSIIPNMTQIDMYLETLIKDALIAGLRYKAQSLYTDVQNQQHVFGLKKEYEFQLNKILDKNPHYFYLNSKIHHNFKGL